MDSVTPDSRFRWLALLVGAALATGSMVPAWAAPDEEPMVFAYAANTYTWVFGPDLIAGEVADRTGVRTAPLGNVHLGRVWTRTIDVTVDDANTTHGRIPIEIAQHRPDGTRPSFRLVCVESGTRTRIRAIKRGHVLRLTVVNDTYGQTLCGGPGGTAGVLTVHR